MVTNNFEIPTSTLGLLLLGGFCVFFFFQMLAAKDVAAGAEQVLLEETLARKAAERNEKQAVNSYRNLQDKTRAQAQLLPVLRQQILDTTAVLRATRQLTARLRDSLDRERVAHNVTTDKLVDYRNAYTTTLRQRDSVVRILDLREFDLLYWRAAFLNERAARDSIQILYETQVPHSGMVLRSGGSNWWRGGSIDGRWGVFSVFAIVVLGLFYYYRIRKPKRRWRL